MKLVILMYLEDDDCVDRLLDETQVPVYADPLHPVRAVQTDVETLTWCGTGAGGPAS